MAAPPRCVCVCVCVAGINVANVNYWTCKKIRDVLTTDKDTAAKNWLGQYKSQATKDWEVAPPPILPPSLSLTQTLRAGGRCQGR